jgi:copper(I)-binding protein
MKRIRKGMMAAGLALMAGMGSALAQDGGIQIDQAWARATPGAATTGAVYVTLRNQGNTPDTLVAASTPVADKAELHLMKIENGVMEMRAVPLLAVPPGQSVVLEPSGYHLMLIGLKKPLKEGDTIPLSLTFEHSGTQQVAVSVAKIGAMHAGDMGAMPGMSSMPGMKH